MILEPDALSGMDCLTPALQQERLVLLTEAVTTLKAQKALVYIDGGNARWKSAEVMATRLRQANIVQADGFTLNVSNYLPDAMNIAYGERVSRLLGGKHFIIDTSRNGLGPTPDFAWCNPPGRALGPRPTSMTGDPLIDAYFWVKRPGDSDGTCNGGPDAGIWWADYALGLAQRADY